MNTIIILSFLEYSPQNVAVPSITCCSQLIEDDPFRCLCLSLFNNTDSLNGTILFIYKRLPHSVFVCVLVQVRQRTTRCSYSLVFDRRRMTKHFANHKTRTRAHFCFAEISGGGERRPRRQWSPQWLHLYEYLYSYMSYRLEATSRHLNTMWTKRSKCICMHKKKSF